jgi:hypothetical protein
MTEALAQKICTPCRGGIAPLTRDEAVHSDGGNKLRVETMSQ